MQSGKVETLQLRDVPPPSRGIQMQSLLRQPGASGEEAPVPRGAKLITSEMSIASTSAQVRCHADQSALDVGGLL